MKRVNMLKHISFLKADIMDGVSKIKPTTIFTTNFHLQVVYWQWWRCFNDPKQNRGFKSCPK
jgi:hypothetical protein